jgi:hypothetical protein
MSLNGLRELAPLVAGDDDGPGHGAQDRPVEAELDVVHHEADRVELPPCSRARRSSAARPPAMRSSPSPTVTWSAPSPTARTSQRRAVSRGGETARSITTGTLGDRRSSASATSAFASPWSQASDSVTTAAIWAPCPGKCASKNRCGSAPAETRDHPPPASGWSIVPWLTIRSTSAPKVTGGGADCRALNHSGCDPRGSRYVLHRRWVADPTPAPRW